MIPGGYYIKARCIQNSDIATAPPYIREIWDWLLKEANHTDTEKIKRGQTLRTFYDIIDGLKWFVGYRKMTYNKGQCENAMRWLRNRGMITTTKTTRGMFITICNYDLYQDAKNYENNSDSITKETREQQGSDTINKNDKNVNKEKELKPITDVSGNSVNPKKILAFINRITSKNYQSISKQTIRQLTACFKLYSNIDLEIAIRNAAHDEFHRKNKHKHLTFLYITRSDQFEKWLQSGPVTKENLSIYREQDNIKPEIATQLQNLLP